jgi:hypothetical protein
MNLSRINIFFILKAHIRSVTDSWILLAMPVIVSAVFLVAKVYMTTDVINISITSISIFTALFFNVSIIMLDMKRRTGYNPDRIDLLKETHNAISFLIVIGILTIASCYGALSTYHWVCVTFNGVAYALLGVFFLTVAMVLKNVHVLFYDDLRRTDKDQYL